jgi:hypothetical protein
MKVFDCVTGYGYAWRAVVLVIITSKEGLQVTGQVRTTMLHRKHRCLLPRQMSLVCGCFVLEPAQ